MTDIVASRWNVNFCFFSVTIKGIPRYASELRMEHDLLFEYIHQLNLLLIYELFYTFGIYIYELP